MTRRITIDVDDYAINIDNGITLQEVFTAAAFFLHTTLSYTGHEVGWETAEEVGGNLLAEVGKQLDRDKEGPPPWRANT